MRVGTIINNIDSAVKSPLLVPGVCRAPVARLPAAAAVVVSYRLI